MKATLRHYFDNHPLQKALARPVYHALQRARHLLIGKQRAAPSPPKRPSRLPHEKSAPVWAICDNSVPVLAVVPADWFGVTTSARNNFPNVLLWQGSDPQETASEILSKGFSTLVFSGMPEPFESVARIIKQCSPSTRLLMHYHGSFAQNAQPGNRERFKQLLSLAKDRIVSKIGFAKAGMAPTVQKLGVDACYVPNRVRRPSVVEHHPSRSPRRVGVFVRDILRKNAHTQFVAASLLEDVEIHTNEVPDLSYVPRTLSIVSHGNLPHKEFLELIGLMDICLYVSLSECYPMVVVESLIRGVPCLTSHTHEIFQYDRELGSKLIVEAHDNPIAIAEQAEEVLADREAIGRCCAAYALELSRHAEAAINRFVEFDVYPLSDVGEIH